MDLESLAFVRRNAGVSPRSLIERGGPDRERVEERLRARRRPLPGEEESDPIDLDIPLAAHPDFRKDLDVARTDALAEKIGFKQSVRRKLAEREVGAGRLTRSALERLHGDGVLSRKQAAELRHAATVYRLVDEREGLVDGLLQDGKLPTGSELVTWDTERWRGVVDHAKGTPPAGLSDEDYAVLLRRKTANAFPQDAIVHHRGRDAKTKAFLARNRALIGRDLSARGGARDEIDFGDLDKEEGRSQLADLLGVQRAISLARDVTDGLALKEAGYHSAVQIASAPSKVIEADTGLDPSRVAQIQGTANAVAAQVAGVLGTIVAEQQPAPQGVGAPFGADTGPWLADLPGFAELFGNQAYCDCEECSSILGAAAYFVDLMRFVQEHVTDLYFTGTHEQHVLSLRNRRPDLWDIELSCDNVNGLIPTLQVVVEVLENAILTETGSPIDLADRAAVEREVYRVLLPAALDSFRQPHHLSVSEINILLGHSEHILDDVGEALHVSGAAGGRVGMAVAPEEWQLITTPDEDLTWLSRVYGIDFTATGREVDPIDVQALLAGTGLTRDELGRLVATQAISGMREQVDLQIVAEKSTPDAVQNDIERLHGASTGSLDRLHRGVRVWRNVPWTIEEMDILRVGVFEARMFYPLQAEVVVLAQLLRIQRQLDLDADTLTTLFAPIPTQPSEVGGESLLDQQFNLDRWIALGGTWPDDTRTYLHPALGEWTDPLAALDHARLMAGTGTDDAGFEALIFGLAPALGIDPEAAALTDRSFALSRDALTLLVRHARLARALELSIEELFGLLELTSGSIATLDDLQAALDLVGWFEDSGWSLDELRAMLGLPPAVTAPWDDPADLADEVVADLVPALAFDSAMLSLVDGVTEAQSLEILQTTPGLEQVDTTTWRIGVAWDPDAPLTLPAEVTADEPDVRAALAEYHASRLLRTVIPGRVDTDVDRIDGLVGLLSADLGAHHGILLGDDPAPLAVLIGDLQRLAALLDDADVFDAVVLQELVADPAILGLADPAHPTLDEVERVVAYRSLRDALPDEVDRAELHGVFGQWDAGLGYAGASAASLAAVLNAARALAAGLAPAVPAGDDAIRGLRDLSDAVELAKELGVGAEAMLGMVSEDADRLADASSALLGALRAQFDDQSEFDEVYAPLRDEILNRKRDGLVDWLVHTGAPQFDEPNDLYHAYLVDVHVDGCARTSRVVAANSSLQLYVQRIRLGLERSPDDADDPVTVPPSAIPGDEWEWRRQYRLWQANRMIFLWPENYVLPAIRDDKTPLFERLESELLAGEITDQAIEEAYGRYLRGLDELSRLRIAGACREDNEQRRTDVLHLVASTADEGGAFYYRRIENLKYAVDADDRAVRWGAWEPLELKIPVKKVTPVVHKGRLYVFWVTYDSKPVQQFDDGTSKFRGYRHQMRVAYTLRQTDGEWTAPQELHLGTYPFERDHPGVVDDPMVTRGFTTISVLGLLDITIPNPDEYGPLYAEAAHAEPIDNYTLRGLGWDRVFLWPGNDLSIRGRDFQMISPIDFYTNTIGEPLMFREHQSTQGIIDYGVPSLNPVEAIVVWLLTFGGAGFFPTTRILWTRPQADDRSMWAGDALIPALEPDAWAWVIARQETVEHYESEMMEDPPGNSIPWWHEVITDYIRMAQVDDTLVGNFRPDEGLTLLPITGSPQDLVVGYEEELFLIQEGARADGRYHVQRLGTSLATDLIDVFFDKGLDAMLSLDEQERLAEAAVVRTTGSGGWIVEEDQVFEACMNGEVDWTGPMGVYLRELFLHIPVLLATHLGDNGKYEEARRWWHVVFDPTAEERDDDVTDTDRTWQYREFREVELDSLRDRLTNEIALEQYQQDPFNPHAIARLRLSAYQKSVVFGYVDNLIANGDALFVQDTMESVNEATLLYVMAQEILGDRPAEIGDCGEVAETWTWGLAEDALVDPDAELLLEVENWLMQGMQAIAATAEQAPASNSARQLTLRTANAAAPQMKVSPQHLERRARALRPESDTETLAGADTTVDVDASLVGPGFDLDLDRPFDPKFPDSWWEDLLPGPAVPLPPEPGGWGNGGEVYDALLLFCVPHNEAMLERWDLVEDRLYKLRNCMNIHGVRRQLALFAPPIDPLLLAQAVAAGLDLDEVLSIGSGMVPPYRFRVLLEKARGYASTLQAFGATFWAALERRDADDLATLQQTHQRDILDLTTRIREQELQISQHARTTLERRVDAAEYRRDYFTGLLEQGQSEQETSQVAMRLSAVQLRQLGGQMSQIASGLALIPQLGAPTAITYGGSQLSGSANALAASMQASSGVHDGLAGISGLYATWERRREGWEHARTQAELELEVLQPQVDAAALRVEIAEQQLRNHERRLDQAEDVLTLFEDRFTNADLLDWRVRELQQLYRDTWPIALGFAQLAEASYHFERDDDAIYVTGALWDSSRSGLLAAERLLVALGQMEQRFIETHSRRAEVNQTFALSQVGAEALIDLRETGACEFEVPELYFDLYYPGHYARRVRAVRLTLPCVTGPYTNVSATLTLLESWTRSAPDSPTLDNVPLTRTTSVATSTAQGDSGVFELDFDGPRYLPFEGAGAVSRWRLELPSRFHLFDYRTITDVLLNISYEADFDAVLRAEVEADDGTLVQTLRSNTSVRVISLRRELSTVFQHLLKSGGATELTLDDRHFPAFLGGRDLTLDSADVALVLDTGQSFSGFDLSFDDVALGGFARDGRLGDLPVATASLGSAAKSTWTMAVMDPGDLEDGVGSWVVDPDALEDILLVLRYTVD